MMQPNDTPDLRPRVAEAATLVSGLQRIGSSWGGWAALPCWGGKELHFNIDPEGEVADIALRQLTVLRAVLQHPLDIRPAFQDALFEYYKAEIEGSYSAYDPVARREIPNSGPPVLTNSSQVWPLIDDPEMWIDWHFRTPTAIGFELTFNCDWDEEHGLGVQFSNWAAVKFGGFDVW